MGHPHYKELIFKSLQYLFIIKKPEKHKTITPNSGRPKNTYSLKVVKLLICILTHPLLAYSSRYQLPSLSSLTKPFSLHPPLANCAFHSPLLLATLYTHPFNIITH